MICLPGRPGNWWLTLSGTWSHHSSANWKVEKEYFAFPSNSQCSWSEKTLLDFLLSSSPPPGGVISNPLTGLCLAVASDVSTLDLLIFEFRSEALHKRSGNHADWLHKFTSWLLWYGQSWEMAGTWLFQFSWYQILGQLQLYGCAPLVLFDIFQRPNITKVRVQVTGDCWRRDQAFKFWPLPRWGRKQW